MAESRAKLEELELIKDRAALRDCEAHIRIMHAKAELAEAEFEGDAAYRAFIVAMRDFFREKVRLADEREAGDV